MKAYRVWEGSKGQKGLRKGGRKVTFKGEELGYWSDGHPTTDRRGTAYRVFRAETGEIVIHRIRWSVWATEDDEGMIFRFPNLDEAVVKFRRVLEKAGVLN